MIYPAWEALTAQIKCDDKLKSLFGKDTVEYVLGGWVLADVTSSFEMAKVRLCGAARSGQLTHRSSLALI